MAKSATLIIDNKSYDLQMIKGTDGPDVIDVRLRHALQRSVPPFIRHGSSITPQCGHTNPLGQRICST